MRQLLGLGLSPDLICARSSTPLQKSVRQKISNFCHVPPEQVYGVHDVTSIYRVPLLLDDEGMGSFLIKRLQLVPGKDAKVKKSLSKWKELADRHDRLQDEVVIGKMYMNGSDIEADLFRLNNIALKTKFKCLS